MKHYTEEYRKRLSAIADRMYNKKDVEQQKKTQGFFYDVDSITR
jgi:hypothetical protein